MNGKIEEEAKEEADQDSLENQQVAGKSALDSDRLKLMIWITSQLRIFSTRNTSLLYENKLLDISP